MKKIKIFFVDFWPVFRAENNYFLDLLLKDYEVEIDPQSPDILFYSCFGTNHLQYNCRKVFFTGENIRPDFRYADFAITFDYMDDRRNYRLPIYALFRDVEELIVKPTAEEPISRKKKFCNFIYSNPLCKTRNRFFKKLNKYKRVDSGGKYLNNIGGRVGDKYEFMRQYKFTIAFENESYPGYTTEKIMEPMIVKSIPIYWGNKLVAKDFNPANFINYHDYESEDALIEHILAVDNNDDLYAKYLSEPLFKGNVLNEFVQPENVRQFLRMIVESTAQPISQQRAAFSKNPLIAPGGKLYDKTGYWNRRIYRHIKYNVSIDKVRLKLFGMIEYTG